MQLGKLEEAKKIWRSMINLNYPNTHYGCFSKRNLGNTLIAFEWSIHAMKLAEAKISNIQSC